MFFIFTVIKDLTKPPNCVGSTVEPDKGPALVTLVRSQCRRSFPFRLQNERQLQPSQSEAVTPAIQCCSLGGHTSVTASVRGRDTSLAVRATTPPSQSRQ